MENPIKVDDLGGTPIFGNTHLQILNISTVSDIWASIVKAAKKVHIQATSRPHPVGTLSGWQVHKGYKLYPFLWVCLINAYA